VALAANALTTLATVLDELGLATDGGGPQDTRLERYITAASALVDSFLDRTLARADGIVEKVAGFGDNFLTVERRPLLAITSISFDGSTIDATNYEIHGDGEAGLIYGRGGFVWTASRLQEIVQTVVTSSERKLFEITYNGGYVTPEQVSQAAFTPQTLPADIEDAVIQMVTTRWRQQGRDQSVKSEKIKSWSATYADSRALPPSIQAVLAPYATAEGV
jgi:hypothetical protein